MSSKWRRVQKGGGGAAKFSINFVPSLEVPIPEDGTRPYKERKGKDHSTHPVVVGNLGDNNSGTSTCPKVGHGDNCNGSDITATHDDLCDCILDHYGVVHDYSDVWSLHHGLCLTLNESVGPMNIGKFL